MFKLLAIDLDGTLLNKEKQVSQKNKDTIKKVIEKGIKVIITSGRIFPAARLHAIDIGTNDPIISCNGAVIKEVSTGDVLYSNNLSHEETLQVIDIARKDNIYHHIYIDDDLYTEKLLYTSLYYRELNKSLPPENRINIRLVDNLTEEIKKFNLKASKIVVMSDEPDSLSLTKNKIKNLKSFNVSSSGQDNFEVMKGSVNKAEALKFLSNKLQIKREEIFAIGDSENDLEMIDYAGFSVAMGNADEIIKRHADCVTLANDENGVSHVIEKYILSSL